MYATACWPLLQAFVCATPARPLRTLRKRQTHPGQTSWQTCTLQRLHRGQQTWSSIVDDAARTIELQLACTSVAHIRRQRTPLCTLASVGSASGMAAPVRGGGAPCAAFDSRLPIRENRQVTSAGRRGRPIFIQVHKMSRLTLVCI